MPESPLTRTRYPTQDDGPYGGEQIQAAVLDLEPYTVPRFTDDTERDVHYGLYTQAGGVLEDGMLCTVGGILMLRKGTGWRVALGDHTLGDAFGTPGTVVTAAPGWTDLAVVTATTTGGPVVARWSGALSNGNSGADRTGSLRLTLDGVEVQGGGAYTGFSLPIAGLRSLPRGGFVRSTPAAGSHTWRVQGNGSAGAAVVSDAAALSVVETV